MRDNRIRWSEACLALRIARASRSGFLLTSKGDRYGDEEESQKSGQEEEEVTNNKKSLSVAADKTREQERTQLRNNKKKATKPDLVRGPRRVSNGLRTAREG